jgi:hypothetical protein
MTVMTTQCTPTTTAAQQTTTMTMTTTGTSSTPRGHGINRKGDNEDQTKVEGAGDGDSAVQRWKNTKKGTRDDNKVS